MARERCSWSCEHLQSLGCLVLHIDVPFMEQNVRIRVIKERCSHESSPGGLSHTPPGGGVGGFQCISANGLQQGSVVRNENTSGTRHCMCRDLMDTSCILRNKTEISWIIALRQIPGAANIALPHCTCVLKSPCPLPSHVDGMTRVLCTRPRRFVETSYLVKYCARVKMFTDCPQRKNTPKAAWSQSSMQP